MNVTPQNNEDIIEDNDFSYDGFQVVRGEFFAHIYEPSFTLNNYKCGVNTACIKRLPDYDYVQILVNPSTKKVAVRPVRKKKRILCAGALLLGNVHPNRSLAGFSMQKLCLS